MQEKESIMVLRCELKIPSLWITVRHHSASLVMSKTEFSIHTSLPLKILIFYPKHFLIWYARKPPSSLPHHSLFVRSSQGYWIQVRRILLPTNLYFSRLRANTRRAYNGGSWWRQWLFAALLTVIQRAELCACILCCFFFFFFTCILLLLQASRGDFTA